MWLARKALLLLLFAQASAAWSLDVQKPALVAWAKAEASRWRQLQAQGGYVYPQKKVSELPWNAQVEQWIFRVQRPQQGRKRQAWEQAESLNQRREARAALVLLKTLPREQWLPKVLPTLRQNPSFLCDLYKSGYQPGPNDGQLYPERPVLGRPWTHGLGLHLEDGEQYRLQWIPDPALLPSLPKGADLPPALLEAPVPSALIHVKTLRSGLERLHKLTGGSSGLIQSLSQGSRMAFTARHLIPWLKPGNPVLDPLAQREAWILHFGAERPGSEGLAGNLIFLPGDLPTRTKLLLDLLKLNPFSLGARNRTVSWSGADGSKVAVEQLRGSGGVWNLVGTKDGAWVSDREALLKAVLFPQAYTTFQDRSTWGPIAVSAMGQATVSLWMLPRLGVDGHFELNGLLRQRQPMPVPTSAISFAKGAPRGTALTAALGGGLAKAMWSALIRLDDPATLQVPSLPAFQGGLPPAQKKHFEEQQTRAQKRIRDRDALRKDVEVLESMLDFSGLSLVWNGWVSSPELSEVQKKALQELRAREKEGNWGDRAAARKEQLQALVPAYGGFGEPGLAPSLALAVRIPEGNEKPLDTHLSRVFPRLFRGQPQNNVGKALAGVTLHRVLTEQALRPSWAIVQQHLIVGTDDKLVLQMASSLMGQVQSLADVARPGWGQAEAETGRCATELEALLLAYLRRNQGYRPWIMENTTADEAGVQLSTSLGPFLSLLKSKGSQSYDLSWGPSGLEAKSR